MKLALIFNPHCRGGLGKKKLQQIETFFTDQKIAYDLFVSKYHRHIIEICADLAVQKYNLIVAIGGDGTNFQVLNGLLKFHKPNQIPPISIIPVGSGNSFAKDLNIHTLNDGLTAAVSGQTKSVDVCSFSQDHEKIYFVNLTGLGFVTDVARTAANFKSFKDLSYIIGVLYRVFSLKFHDVKIQIDDEIITGKNCFVEFCNSRFTGGNMLMAPKAEIDDGLMDIIITGKLTRFSLLKTLPEIFKGTHIHHPAVTYRQARKAIVQTTPQKILLPDGEIIGKTPTTIEVHPKLVRYAI